MRRLDERTKEAIMRLIGSAAGVNGMLYEEDGFAYLVDRHGNVVVDGVQDHRKAIAEAIKLGGTILVSGSLKPGVGVNPVEWGIGDVDVKFKSIGDGEFLIDVDGGRLFVVPWNSGYTGVIKRIAFEDMVLRIVGASGAKFIEIDDQNVTEFGILELRNCEVVVDTDLDAGDLFDINGWREVPTVRRVVIEYNDFDLRRTHPFEAESALGNFAVHNDAEFVFRNNLVWDRILNTDPQYYGIVNLCGDTYGRRLDSVHNVVVVEAVDADVVMFEHDGNTAFAVFNEHNNICDGVSNLGTGIVTGGVVGTYSCVGNMLFLARYGITVMYSSVGNAFVRGNLSVADPSYASWMLPAVYLGSQVESAVVDGNIIDLVGAAAIGDALVWIDTSTGLLLNVVNNFVKNFTAVNYDRPVRFWGVVTVIRMLIKGNYPWVDEGGRVSVLSGDGVSVDFLLGAHNLSFNPVDPGDVVVVCTPASPDAIAASPVVCYLSDEDGDGAYESVRARFAVAPAAGTNNVKVSWRAYIIRW